MKIVQANGIDLQKYPWEPCVIGNGRDDTGHGGTTGATASVRNIHPMAWAVPGKLLKVMLRSQKPRYPWHLVLNG